jgi:hypothetical protein
MAGTYLWELPDESPVALTEIFTAEDSRQQTSFFPKFARSTVSGAVWRPSALRPILATASAPYRTA